MVWFYFFEITELARSYVEKIKSSSASCVVSLIATLELLENSKANLSDSTTLKKPRHLWRGFIFLE